MADPIAGEVRAQYEGYPYPARNPRDEQRRLVTGSPSHLLEIDHHLHAGRLSSGARTAPFRVLVAGGGTGDALIMLAQQLADRGLPAEIVYLDLSVASRRIAEARAAMRGLTSIAFHTGSLLAAAQFGRFDYIDCCGVLHHLPDPAAGLRALVDALSPEGGIGLMVYGELGRTGVYPMQRVLRQLGAGLGDAERLALARRVLKALPPGNWFGRNPLLSDHLSNDAGLYDLLLHSQDRAYRVPELLDLLSDAGLRLASFVEPARYEPEHLVADPMLRRRFAELSLVERAALAEDLAGTMKSHMLYAVRAERTEDTTARIGPQAIPVLREMEPAATAAGLDPGGVLTADLGGTVLKFPLPKLGPAIIARIDGKATLDEIRRSLPGAPDPEVFDRQFAELYRAFSGINRLLLRYES